MRPYLENIPARLRVEPNVFNPFPEHMHVQVELLSLFSGSMTLLADGESVPLQAGDIGVCFPGTVHGYGASENASGVMIIFSPELSSDFSSVLTRMRPTQPVLRAAQLHGDVPGILRQMHDECISGRDERVLRGYLQVLLARILPAMTLREQNAAELSCVYRVVQYLSEHYAEPLTLPMLSRALGVSESYLSRTFSTRLKTGFRTYLNALRIDRACLLLRSTGLSVTRIAYECGYESQRTFNRAFAEQHAVTPTEYRQLHAAAPFAQKL